MLSTLMNGIGPTEYHNITLMLGLPSSKNVTNNYNKVMKSVYQLIIDAGMKTVSYAFEEEVELQKIKDKLSPNSSVGLNCSYDMAWQQKAAGRLYKSRFVRKVELTVSR